MTHFASAAQKPPLERALKSGMRRRLTAGPMTASIAGRKVRA